MKNVYVILGFRAHEPNKDIGNQILQETADPDLKKAVPFENQLAKNSALVRDTFLALIQLSKNFNVPVCLSASNEMLSQLRNVAPETFAKLREAYQDGSIYPILNFAFDAHVLYSSAEEVGDEIRLNIEFLEDIVEISTAKYMKHRGVCPPECSIDIKKINAFNQVGVEYLIAPHLKEQFVATTVTPQVDVDFSPLQLENGMVIFPRNCAVSEGLWQVLIRLKPKWALEQGYVLGEFPVFTQEYVSGQYLKFPISLQEAIDEYTGILRQVVSDAPDNGVIFSMQRLDMVNFGEWALGIIGAAWQNIIAENSAVIHFVTPEQILDSRNKAVLPKVKFDEICWFPENRVILNIDGHYPPLGIAEYMNYNVGERLWKKWPFIFWEPGRQLTTVFHTLFANFGFRTTGKIKVRDLMQQNLLSIDLSEQMVLHLRFMKRATNWISTRDEDLLREVFLHAYYIAKKFSLLNADPSRFQKISEESLNGIGNISEIFIGNRIHLLQSCIQKMEQVKMIAFPTASPCLSAASLWREKASFALRNIENLNRSGKNTRELLVQLSDCFKYMFLSLDNIHRVTKEIPDKEFIYTEMYKQLYKIFPPKLHSSLEMFLYK